MKSRTVTLIFVLLFAILIAACGGSSADEATQVESTRLTSEQESVEPLPQVDVPAENITTTDSGIIMEEPAEELAAESEAPAGSAAPIEGEEADATTGMTAPQPLATSGPIASDEIALAPTTPTPASSAPTDMFFAQYGVNPFILTSVDNLSTFSLDVDTGSYNVARNYLRDGLQPPPTAIRVEEFVNSFEQGYPIPTNSTFAVYADGAPSPFHNDGTYFVRIGVQGYDVPVEQRPSANLTFVIDVSGSMDQEDRLFTVKEALRLLVDQLRPDDTVSIVVYGTDARVVLPPTAGSERSQILSAIYSLNAEGSTNMEAGLLLGYDQANRAYKSGGINRVILASDGVANVGDTGPNSLAAKIRDYADAGIYLTTVGVGMGNFNDVMMEQLADQGEGNYAYVDTLDEAEEVFVHDLMSTLQTIAQDTKIQVEFDPNVVQQYRLIGYENRDVADSQFRDNDIDAGEIGAGHTATAVYAIQFVPGAQGRVGTVYLRWQNPETRAVQEINGTFTTNDLAPSFDAAPIHFQQAVVVSQWAELLRDSYWASDLSMNDLRIRAERLAGQLGTEQAQELAQLIGLSQ